MGVRTRAGRGRGPRSQPGHGVDSHRSSPFQRGPTPRGSVIQTDPELVLDSATEPITAIPPGRFGGRLHRWEALALAALIVVYLAVAVDGILLGAPLGHDEAVYSSQARTYAEGAPTVGFWDDYRAPGLPWVLQLAWLGSATEPYLRSVVAVMGVAGLLCTWLLGRYLFGRIEGLVAAGGLAASPIWMGAATHVWPDVPGAAIGLGALAVLMFATHDDDVSWWVLLAAPLVLAATVTRYGAPGPIAVGALGIAWWRWAAVRRRPGRVAVLAAVTALPLYVLLLTNVVFDTTTPPLRAALQLRPNRGGTLADGWVVLWDQLPALMAQPATVFMFIGLATAAAVRIRNPELRRRRTLVIVVALGTLIVLATALSSELRYFAPLLPWMWLAAALGLVRLVRPLEPRAVVALGIVSALALGFGVVASNDEGSNLLFERFQRLREVTRDRDWSAGCHIATSYGPQVGWYTGCTTVPFVLGEDLPLPPEESPTDILVVAGGKRQPVSLAPWLEEHAVISFSYGDRSLGSLQYIEVYEPVR